MGIRAIRMRTIRNYVLLEIFKVFFLSVFVVAFVMLLVNFLKIPDLIVNKGISPHLLGKFVFYFLLTVLSYVLPIAMLTAVILVFGRFSADNEIDAIRSSGISLFWIAFPVFLFAFAISLFALLMNDKIIPYSHFQMRRISVEIGLKSPGAYLEPGRFIDEFPGYIMFIYQMPAPNKLRYIRIYQLRHDLPARTIVADRGDVIINKDEGKVHLHLIKGTSDEPNPRNPMQVYKLNFNDYYMNLKIPGAGKKIEKKLKEFSIKELLNEKERLEGQGIDIKPIEAQISNKIALSFAPFIFAIIGLPFSIRVKRQEKSLGVLLVIMIAVVYYLLLLGAEALSIRGIINPWIGMWVPNIVLFFAGVLLLKRQ